jgi:putative ABC transport system ATP-binding protein
LEDRKMSIARLEGVDKDYVTGEVKVPALKDVNLEIGQGEFLSIAGPSGSGKTTLLNLIGCLDVPTRGKVFMDGIDIATLKPDDRAELRRNEIGFIFQTFNLVPVLTAFENVEFPLTLLGHVSAEKRKSKVEGLLKTVGLGDMMHRRPLELSGGQQQRVAIARALVKSPKLVLADEPTANLDSKTGMTILDLMKDINQKEETTFIFSTHDQMVMDFARRLIILRDGKIAEDNKR